MKVAVTCDYLLERNHYTEVIEEICELFPAARLYCFAHKQGKILGRVEQRMISSTYLSKKVETEAEFYSYSYQIPSLAKNMFISCEYDLIINISRGFSQGIKKCDSSRLITYLYDLGYDNKIQKTFLQKIFYSFVLSWVKKTLKQSELVMVSRDDIKLALQSVVPDAVVVPPPFKISDYSLFPKNMFKHDYFVIEATGLSLEQAEAIALWMNEWELPFQFIGNDEHLSAMKTNSASTKFFGKRCCGEHTPLLAGAKALISFNDLEFPKLVIGTLCTGRPVIVGNELKKWVSGTGTYFASLHKGSLRAMIDEVEANEEMLDGQKIREHVLKFHDTKFKMHIKRVLDSYA